MIQTEALKKIIDQSHEALDELIHRLDQFAGTQQFEDPMLTSVGIHAHYLLKLYELVWDAEGTPEIEVPLLIEKDETGEGHMMLLKRSPVVKARAATDAPAELADIVGVGWNEGGAAMVFTLLAARKTGKKVTPYLAKVEEK